MTAITADQLAAWKRLADAATPEPWTTEKPGMDAATGFARGVIVAAVARGQGIYANPPGGSYPESDRRFIAAARTAVPALITEVERLREAWSAAADLAKVLMAATLLCRELGPVDPRSVALAHKCVAGVAAIAAGNPEDICAALVALRYCAALPEEPADG